MRTTHTFYRYTTSIILLSVLLSGCVAKTYQLSPTLVQRDKSREILLMPMDVELSLLTAGGILEPQAEWTAKAQKNLEAAIEQEVEQSDIALLNYRETGHVTMATDEEQYRLQLMKLHEVVGYSILLHHYNTPFALPGKQGGFDWGLGQEAQFLKEKYGADYALFVFVRDSYTSSGRMVVLLIGAALGVGIPGGSQVGFASLVDLETGDIVWFNRLISNTGDLRTLEAAAESVKQLLANLPR